LDGILIGMNKFFLTLSAFAMIVSVTVCVSHAHATIDTEISISIDDHNHQDDSLSGNSCDMSCGGCCVHHAIALYGANDLASADRAELLMPDTALLVSDVIYDLKRPPRV
jgi:hypothetical protein